MMSCADVPVLQQTKLKENVVSTHSFAPATGITGYSSYAPSKFALRGLADCLRNEVIPFKSGPDAIERHFSAKHMLPNASLRLLAACVLDMGSKMHEQH